MNFRINYLPKNNHIIYYTLRSLTEILNEIHEYNVNYWSLYIFWIWISCALAMNILIYLVIYSTYPIIQITFLFFSSILILCLTIFISSAASVNLEVNKSYKLMYSLVFSRNRNVLSKAIRVKVAMIVIL